MDAGNWLDAHRPTLEAMPFLSMVIGTRKADRPMITRTIENLITAGIAAGIVMWSNDKVQDFKLEQVQRSIAELRADTKAEQAALRAAVLELRIDIATHAAPPFPTPPRRRTP